MNIGGRMWNVNTAALTATGRKVEESGIITYCITRGRAASRSPFRSCHTITIIIMIIITILLLES